MRNDGRLVVPGDVKLKVHQAGAFDGVQLLELVHLDPHAHLLRLCALAHLPLRPQPIAPGLVGVPQARELLVLLLEPLAFGFFPQIIYVRW